MLTTEEGKTHRFRDSQTLQKWVVERRVTRADRVCPPGGAWRRLGDVDELRPFFDVVAQADRAAAAARGTRPTRPETPRASGSSRPYVSADLDDDDVLGGRSRRPVLSGAFNDDISTDDDLAMAGIGARHPGRKLLIGLVVVFVGLAAYLGFRGTAGLHLPGIGPASPPSAAPLPPPVATAPAAAPAAPPPVATAPAAVPAAPVVPAAPLPASPPPIAAAPAPAALAPKAPAGPVAKAPAEESAPSRPGAPHELAAGGDAHPRSYEHLIAEADRAIENGQTAKAQKLYDEALKLQPSGVAAVTGSAYVLLDRQKPLAAIDTFKRALGAAPSFAPALFGLAEAYRLEGEPAPAIAAYKRYLEASPSGADAPAARRQIRELESQAPAPSRGESPAPAAPTEPPSAP
jgi:tetratricopeptide repeat protein